MDIIWVGQSSSLNLESSHHAALFTELIFNYGDTFLVQGQHVEHFQDQYVHQTISGLKTEPFQTKVSGRYQCVGLILKPFCFGMLKSHWGSRGFARISELAYETLIDCENPSFKRLEGMLWDLFSNNPMDADLMQFERFVSERNLEKGTMNDFNRSISLSQKSFIQKFKRHYLLTPVEYFQLTKVNQSIALIENNTYPSLTETALDAGFYDQSHFIKTFRKFCGYSPKNHRSQILG